MDAGVGSTGSCQSNWSLNHNRQTRFHNLLNGQHTLLALPPVVVGAVIFED
jgi:putative hemolysin